MDRPAILATDLVKTFGKDVRALDGLSLEVPQGSVLGLLGPNGAGKTTAVNVLTTLLRPDSGHAEVVGVDVVAEPERARRQIGLAGQYAAVDEKLTGRENLVLVGRLNHRPRTEVHGRARELLERFDLVDAADRQAGTYSGGMRRRLDLAAALVAQPPVLFLDEPTTGLDPRSRLDLWRVIEELVGGGTTLLLTTQYLEEADRLADRIAVVDHGRVIAEGTSSELKAGLGGAMVEVTLPDDEPVDDVVALLAGTGSGEVSSEGRAVRVPAGEGSGTATLAEVVRRLDDAGTRTRTLGLREPSLDDVFLSLTGHGTAVGDEGDEGDGTDGPDGSDRPDGTEPAAGGTGRHRGPRPGEEQA